jgi:hypothetical protein
MFLCNCWACTDCFDDCGGVWKCKESLVCRVLAKGGEVNIDGGGPFVCGSALSRYTQTE